MSDVLNLEFCKLQINKCIETVASGAVKIGFYLNQIKHFGLWVGNGYGSFYDYCDDQFKINRTSCKRFIELNEKYSVKDDLGDNTDCIDKQYIEYSPSLLHEMVSLPDDIKDNIDPGTTISSVRKMKNNINQVSFPDEVLKVLYENNYLNDYMILDKKSIKNDLLILGKGYRSILLDPWLITFNPVNVSINNDELLLENDFTYTVLTNKIYEYICNVKSEICKSNVIANSDTFDTRGDVAPVIDNNKSYVIDFNYLNFLMQKNSFVDFIKDHLDYNENLINFKIMIKHKASTVSDSHELELFFNDLAFNYIKLLLHELDNN